MVFGSKNGKMKELFGDLENNDKPMRILKARKCETCIEFIVEWKPRENNFKPKNSVVTNKELRKQFPFFLIDYYEQNLIFEDPKSFRRNQARDLRHVQELEKMIPEYHMRLEKGANKKLTSIETQMFVEKMKQRHADRAH